MARARSNLFSIDQEAIPALLAEANARLLARRDELLAAFERVPAVLRTDDEVARARRFAELIRKAVAEAEAARKSDKRPFLAGSKAVQAFFDGVTRPLAATLRQLDARLTEAAIHARPAAAAAPAAQRVVVAGPGAPVVTAEPPPPTGEDEPPSAAAARLPLIWEVAHIDRAALDLEALRDLFTDRELDAAVQRWLRTHGPGGLRGVEFRRVVRTRAMRGAEEDS